MEEILTVKGHLKVVEAIIKELKEDSYSRGKEIARLEELSLTKV